MKFSIKNKTKENSANLLRSSGYHYFGIGKEMSELVFVRPAGQDAYPRFHLYLKEDKKTGEIFCSLHLDQRKTVYKGSTAHSGEYDGELVEEEANRIRTMFGSGASKH